MHDDEGDNDNDNDDSIIMDDRTQRSLSPLSRSDLYSEQRSPFQSHLA